MTSKPVSIEAASDPEGSIFLSKSHESLSPWQYTRERFAIMLGRGAYRGMELDDLEAADRELQLRLAITSRLGENDSPDSESF